MINLKEILPRINQLLELELSNCRKIMATSLSSDLYLVNDMYEYICQNSGKMLRPIIHIMISKLLNYNSSLNHHIKLAAAIEFIHIATILHDDVIDNGQLRHNKVTTNLKFDNKSAILMGDLLFSKSFELMVETNSLPVLKTLSNSSSIIAEGELNQLVHTRNIDITESEYTKIITHKTAYLFRASSICGGIISNANSNILNLVEQFGYNFGLAYQIIDDIKDFTANNNQADFGKELGNDIKEGKITLPLILLLKEAKLKEKQLITSIISKPNVTDNDCELVSNLISDYNCFDKSYNIAKNYIQRANDAIELINKYQKNQSITMAEHLIALANSLIVK